MLGNKCCSFEQSKRARREEERRKPSYHFQSIALYLDLACPLSAAVDSCVGSEGHITNRASDGRFQREACV